MSFHRLSSQHSSLHYSKPIDNSFCEAIASLSSLSHNSIPLQSSSSVRAKHPNHSIFCNARTHLHIDRNRRASLGRPPTSELSFLTPSLFALTSSSSYPSPPSQPGTPPPS
jgi:hypothetical protein